MIKSIFLAIVCTLYSQAAKAHGEASAASRGTGGIGYLSSNFTDVFFSHPSHITEDKRSFVLKFFDINFSVSSDVGNTVLDYLDESESNSDNNEGSAAVISTLKTIKKYFGKNISGDTHVEFFSMKIGNFTLVPYLHASMYGVGYTPAWPEVEGEVDAYMAMGAGYAYQYEDFGFGLNIRPGFRYYGAIDLDIGAIGDFTSSNGTTDTELIRFGQGPYSPVDLGFSYRLSPTIKLHANFLDLLGSPSGGSTNGIPPAFETKFNLGMIWESWKNGRHSFAFASEFKDLFNFFAPNGYLFNTHIGGEYRYSFGEQPFIALRVGLNQGFPTLGAYMDLFVFKLAFSYSAYEKGHYIGQNPIQLYTVQAFSQISF